MVPFTFCLLMTLVGQNFTWFVISLFGMGLTLGCGSPTAHVVIYRDMLAACGAVLIDALLIVGIIAAIFPADRFGRIKRQIFGFIGRAAGLLFAVISAQFDGQAKLRLIFAGFMLFNFMTNPRPNAMTYLMAGEIFPTGVRGLGAVFAVSFAKIGAVVRAFLFPSLLQHPGTAGLLHRLVGPSSLGALANWWFQIETNGVNLETIGNEPT